MPPLNKKTCCNYFSQNYKIYFNIMQFNHYKPLVIFDEECGFCLKTTTAWKKKTRQKIDYVSYQVAHRWFPEIDKEHFEKEIHLVDEYGNVFRGAKAVFKLFTYALGIKKYYLSLYEFSQSFASLSEWGYQKVAQNRRMVSRLSTILFGDLTIPETFHVSASLFYRGLGFVFCLAFLSLFVQLDGLFLSNGLLPIQSFIASVSQKLTFLKLPSLFLLNSSDLFLKGSVLLGVIASITLMLGYFPLMLTALLWILYLSFVNTGQLFLSYQWDVLLLEVSFLSLFLYPFFSTHVSRLNNRSTIFNLLLKFLLFRILFFSGYVKLASGDPAWSSLKALEFHFYTQPLPHLFSWFAHQLPSFLKYVLTIGMFAIELVIPFLLFFPRRLRHISIFFIVSLMISIMLTGNYGFFNILVIVLCLAVTSDSALRPFSKFLSFTTFTPIFRRQSVVRTIVVGSFGVFLLLNMIILEGNRLFQMPGKQLVRDFQGLRLVNPYGLFAVMTSKRYELTIQASMDGEVWKDYEFYFKPNDHFSSPSFVFPHQPRLDWQLWFVALRDYRRSPWLMTFITALFEGKEDVLTLVKTVPYKNPRYIRVLAHDRVFTDMDTLKESGQWWEDKSLFAFTPVFEYRSP